MIVVTRKYTRPSADVAWHTDVPAHELLDNALMKRLKIVYIKSGKLKMQHWNQLDDLNRVHVSVWDSQESFEQYDTDPEFNEFMRLRDAYNSAVGITIGPKEFSDF